MIRELEYNTIYGVKLQRFAVEEEAASATTECVEMSRFDSCDCNQCSCHDGLSKLSSDDPGHTDGLQINILVLVVVRQYDSAVLVAGLALTLDSYSYMLKKVVVWAHRGGHL
jgi:hypothetical protein